MIMQLEDFDLSGYRQGLPPHRGLIDGTAIDREIAEEEPCAECGGKCEYVSMIAEGSYRAFSRCTVCGETIEF